MNGFDRDVIDSALKFLQLRRNNHGRSDGDFELNDETKNVFSLMQQYNLEIKQMVMDSGIDLTHITTVSPDNMVGGKIRKSMDRANNYETQRVDAVFAASTPIDGSNPYLARNSTGMIYLGESRYIYGGDNIDVVTDENGEKRAKLKNPNYVYYINPDGFTPVSNLTIDSKTGKPRFEFSEEWISPNDVDIFDSTQIRKVVEVSDVTPLLHHFDVLCDVHSKGFGIVALRMGDKAEAFRMISNNIENGNIRYINREVGIDKKRTMNINVQGIET